MQSMLRSVALHRASVGITIHQAHMRGSSKPGSEAGQSTAGHARNHWTPCPTTNRPTSQYHYHHHITSTFLGTTHLVVQIDQIHLSIP